MADEKLARAVNIAPASPEVIGQTITDILADGFQRGMPPLSVDVYLVHEEGTDAEALRIVIVGRFPRCEEPNHWRPAAQVPRSDTLDPADQRVRCGHPVIVPRPDLSSLHGPCELEPDRAPPCAIEVPC